MKILLRSAVLILLCFGLLSIPAYAAGELIPVGEVIGLELRDGTVTVEGFDPELGKPCKDAGLQAGDVIKRINGSAVRSCDDLRHGLERSDGAVTLTVDRTGQTLTFKIAPHITAEGPKLGLYLRQGVTGIGTVTWYDPDTGKFGALGHGVSNGSGKLVTMTEGWAYSARVLTVKKGRSGTPGQLMGAIRDPKPIGALTGNTPQGVFCKTEKGWSGTEMSVAESNEVHAGPATILSTVQDGQTREYSVEILKIYPQARQSGRNLLIHVTDPALLEITGGIVQGMSGSPILQDGKLVGAVTHVLVNDPTTGYGIFIENMLNAAA